jgi:hypothetical protein
MAFAEGRNLRGRHVCFAPSVVSSLKRPTASEAGDRNARRTPQMRRLANAQLLSACLAFWLSGCGANPSGSDVAAGTIEVDNVNEGETVNSQIVLVSGRLSAGGSRVQVRGGDTVAVNGERSWRVVYGRFKCLVPLVPGMNAIELSAPNHQSARFNVRYVPRTSGPAVRIVYAMAADDDGAFQSVLPGEPNDRETAVRRLRFGALLIQTAYAELMRTAGYGRRTFRLLREDSGDVSVSCVRLDETLAELHRHQYWQGPNNEWLHSDPPFTAEDLWRKIYAKLDRLWPGENTNRLTYLAFSRQDAVSRTEHGVATLGGGRLATQNSIRLYAYPETLAQVEAVLYDSRLEAGYGLIGADTFWRAWGTHLGGAAHELGHTFGLGHTSQWLDLMSGGFYSFWRLFAPVDGDGQSYPLEGVPFLANTLTDGSPHAARLADGPWFVFEQ